MARVNQHVRIWAGDAKNLNVTALDDDGGALNLTGGTLTWILRQDARSGPVLLTKTIGSGITVTNAAGGLFTVALVEADTQDLAGSYYHECVFEDSGGNPSTILTGNFILENGAVMYCTVAEVREQVNKDNADDDNIIGQIIEAVTSWINDYCNRPDGFLAPATGTARVFSGSGTAIQPIDECVEVSLVEVKDSPTDSAYTAWAAGDWLGGSGEYKSPDFTHTPYDWLMVDPTGDESHFTTGEYITRRGFRPEFGGMRGVPTVRVTARWGYSANIPPPVRQACIAQVARWYKRAQSSWADSLANYDTGMLQFRQVVDPDIKAILNRGGLRRTLYG